MYSQHSGGQKFKIKMAAGSVSSGGSEGEPIPYLSPSFWWLPGILATPWFAPPQSPTSISTLRSSLCDSFSVSYKDILIGFRAHRDPGWISILAFITSANNLFANKVTFRVSQRTWVLEGTVQPTLTPPLKTSQWFPVVTRIKSKSPSAPWDLASA